MTCPSVQTAGSAEYSASSLLIADTKGTRGARRSPLSQAGHQAWHDLKTAYRHIAKREVLFYLAWTGVLLGLLIFLAVWSSEHKIGAVCEPDGTFSTDSYKFDYWTTGFFEISLAFGEISFTGATTLDVAFQLVRPLHLRSLSGRVSRLSEVAGAPSLTTSIFSTDFRQRGSDALRLPIPILEGVLDA